MEQALQMWVMCVAWNGTIATPTAYDSVCSVLDRRSHALVQAAMQTHLTCGWTGPTALCPCPKIFVACCDPYLAVGAWLRQLASAAAAKR